ncbi:MAG: type IV toxin-antitoxin system AbiEi family antitoxin [Propionibacteriaceae bacterium]|nr:type IV toxin-antitoxin system AbiEi family antitoxin [Propionibacteriaceae bacterium]
MTAQRSLPQRLAGMVEQMELDQPRVVTMPELSRIAVETGACHRVQDAPKLVYWLQELGWLGKVRTKGVWEFYPGARAGAYGSGDRFIEFRAQQAVNPDWPGVLAMESAASLLGLSQHVPDREVVALPKTSALPKAMYEWRCVTVDLPPEGRDVHDGLPHWTLDGLVAGIAIRPSGYTDLAGLAQWLPDVGPRLDADTMASCLHDTPAAAWQRAAYLARIAGAIPVAEELLTAHPPTTPAWFGGARAAGARYDLVTKVSDVSLHPYLEGGVGA